MAQGLINDSTLNEIGNAIREKRGETEAYLPSIMPEKIRGIKAGSTYTAGENISIVDDVISTKLVWKEGSPGSIEIPTGEVLLKGKLYSEIGNKTIFEAINNKQGLLVSGTNIKTINGESILGSGNITIHGEESLVNDVKVNGNSVVADKIANITVPTKTTDLTNDSNYITAAALSGYAKSVNGVAADEQGEITISIPSPYDDTEIRQLISEKQDNLVSGTNIKTINGESVLGEGNIEIQGGGSNVIMEENPNGGVDLTVEDSTETLAKQEIIDGVIALEENETVSELDVITTSDEDVELITNKVIEKQQSKINILKEGYLTANYYNTNLIAISWDNNDIHAYTTGQWQKICFRIWLSQGHYRLSADEFINGLYIWTGAGGGTNLGTDQPVFEFEVTESTDPWAEFQIVNSMSGGRNGTVKNAKLIKLD